jgi:hypothetical protein
MKRAGKVKVPAVRDMVTWPSSDGCWISPLAIPLCAPSFAGVSGRRQSNGSFLEIADFQHRDGLI